MRTIKFRGKRLDGQWVYGSLIASDNVTQIHVAHHEIHAVDPTTVGQFTGLFDKNGTEIYLEINQYLYELMGFISNVPKDSSEVFKVTDQYNRPCDFRKHIGMKPLNTLANILLLKSCIDYERGFYYGKIEAQKEIKKALGID